MEREKRRRFPGILPDPLPTPRTSDPPEPVLLYFGPEVLMPVASAVAAALGAILVFGRRILAWLRAAGRWIAGRFGDSHADAREPAAVAEAEREETESSA